MSTEGDASLPTTPPRVSIVTPSYQQGRFLADAIESVLAQDYPDIDHSVAVLKRYAGRIAHWESERDDGQAHALNKGFARATGDIFGWLNADDTYEPGAVRSAVAALVRQPDVDVVSGRCRLWFGDAR